MEHNDASRNAWDASQDEGGLYRWYRLHRDAIAIRLQDRETRPITIVMLFAAVLHVLAFGLWVWILVSVPSGSELEHSRFEGATVVYARDGTELTRYQVKNRRWILIEDVSPAVVQALIATEDRRFFRHNGIDLIRTGASLIATLDGRRQGGSTITMQFARNAFPDIYDDWVAVRKIKEWITALRIEAIYGKDDILEMYLNTVPFVYNAFGIEAGAQTYFKRSATELDVKEAATLIGMLKGPVFYNPVRNPERAHERRNLVLQQMVKNGYLEKSTFEAIADEPTVLDFTPLTRASEPAPYFSEHVRQFLDEWAADRNVNLYTEGLRVYTTIDMRLQEAAHHAVETVGDDLQAVADVEWSRAGLPYFSSNAAGYHRQRPNVTPFEYFWDSHPQVLESSIRTTSNFRNLVSSGVEPGRALDSLRRDASLVESLKARLQRVEAGFVAIDPGTGHVLAWVGGRDFREVKFDHVAMSKRQPGSAFKPFVYAAALSHGYSEVSRMRDEVVEYVDQRTGRRWAPTNVGASTGNLISLRDALAYSKNTVTARLAVQLGPGTVAAYARRMGIESEMQAVPSIALGTSVATLLEVTKAFATIANYGRRIEPVFVTHIEDRSGRVIARFGGNSSQAISSTVAYSVLNMMRGVVDYGTGQRIRHAYGVREDVAGKTGTSQRGADGWFLLVHPNVVMGSWVGFSTPAVYFRSSYWGQGARTALPIVGEFSRAARNDAPDVFSPSARFDPPVGYVEPRVRDHSWVSFDQYVDPPGDLDSGYEGERWRANGFSDSDWIAYGERGGGLSASDSLNRLEREQSQLREALLQLRGD